jgi:hypothetical protein
MAATEHILTVSFDTNFIGDETTADIFVAEFSPNDSELTKGAIHIGFRSLVCHG